MHYFGVFLIPRTPFYIRHARRGFTMLLMFMLGCFVLPSLTEGDNKTFTCSPGPLKVTCDAGKVILIKQVRRGSYTSGAFNSSHCKYQVGDSTEVDDSNSKDVWENCNLQSTCSIPFIQLGNIYLELDYECVHKNNIDMLDICDTGSDTRLVAKHGYIYSPCYPNLSKWTNSTHAYCQCSGTFQLPVQAEKITISVFNAFQETESLEIRWHTISNRPWRIANTSSSFRTQQSAADRFHVTFYSSYQGSDWDRGFWFEFTANSPLEFKCSNTHSEKKLLVTPPTCQPSPTSTSTTTTMTTPTTTISAATTPTTTLVPTSTTKSNPGGSSPAVKTTISSTVIATASTTYMTSTEAVVGGPLSQRDIVTIAVGTIVPLIVIAVIIATVLIIRRKRQEAAAAKSKSNDQEELALNGSAVGNGAHINPSYDPESGEEIHDAVEETSIVEDDPSSLYSLAEEMVQLDFGSSPKDAADKEVLSHAFAYGDHATKPVVPSKPKPSVKPRPAPRKIGSKKDDAPSESEDRTPAASVFAEMVKKNNREKATVENSASEKLVTKTGPPKPRLNPKPAAKLKLGSQKDTGASEGEYGNSPNVYTEVKKKGRRDQACWGKQRPAGEDSASEVGKPEAHVEVEPDLYTDVNKSAKRKIRPEKPIVDINQRGVSKPQTGDIYSQVDKSAKPNTPKKPEVHKRNIGGASVAAKKVDDAPSGDVYAQVQKGKKTAPPRGEVPRYENVTLGINKTENPGENEDLNDDDLYSSTSVDVGVIVTPPGVGGDDLYSSTSVDIGVIVTPPGVETPPGNEDDAYSDNDLYGSVKDEGGYADYAYAEGRGYDDVDSDYGEIGDTQYGGPMEPDEDTYDHAALTSIHSMDRQAGGSGPLAPSEPQDDTYDHVALEFARKITVQTEENELSDLSDAEA